MPRLPPGNFFTVFGKVFSWRHAKLPASVALRRQRADEKRHFFGHNAVKIEAYNMLI